MTTISVKERVMEARWGNYNTKDERERRRDIKKTRVIKLYSYPKLHNT